MEEGGISRMEFYEVIHKIRTRREWTDNLAQKAAYGRTRALLERLGSRLRNIFPLKRSGCIKCLPQFHFLQSNKWKTNSEFANLPDYSRHLGR